MVQPVHGSPVHGAAVSFPQLQRREHINLHALWLCVSAIAGEALVLWTFVQSRSICCDIATTRTLHGQRMPAEALHQPTHQPTSLEDSRLNRHGNGSIVDVDAAPFVVVAVGLEMA